MPLQHPASPPAPPGDHPSPRTFSRPGRIPARRGRSALLPPAALSLAAAFLAACGGESESEPASAPAPATQSAPAASLAPLSGAAAWQGDLPCADCPGIRTVLVLDPHGTFGMQEGYLGRGPGADTLAATHGRWTISTDRDRITLHGSGESPRHYSPRADGTLRMLDMEGNEIASELNYTLAPLPAVPTLGGWTRVLGLFTYMADAALLVECSSGLQLPVAMEAGYLDLERAYGAAGVEPGAPLLVRVQGRVEDRPAMEGDGTERSFVVEESELADGEGCDALAVREALASGEWQLASLDGQGVEPPPGAGSLPTIQWNPLESQVAGSAGCNRYTGRGFLRGTLLVTGPAAATRMLCEGTMELEDRFLAVMAEGGVLRLEGGEFVLFRGPEEVARFNSRPGTP